MAERSKFGFVYALNEICDGLITNGELVLAFIGTVLAGVDCNVACLVDDYKGERLSI